MLAYKEQVERWHCGDVAIQVTPELHFCEHCECVYIHEQRKWIEPKHRRKPTGAGNRLSPVGAWLMLDQPYACDEVAQTLVAKAKRTRLTLHEIGHAMGTTRENIRIIERQAMTKLRLRLAKVPDGAKILDQLNELSRMRGGYVYPEGGCD